MMSHPLDVSYMGVYTIWMNDIGTCVKRPKSEYQSDTVQGANPIHGSPKAPYNPMFSVGSVV